MVSAGVEFNMAANGSQLALRAPCGNDRLFRGHVIGWVHSTQHWGFASGKASRKKGGDGHGRQKESHM